MKGRFEMVGLSASIRFFKGRAPTLAAVILLGTALAGCSAIDRIGGIGEQPPLSSIDNPTTNPGYRPVSLPMPAPVVAERLPNALWRTGSRTFFKDQRASRVGDLLTVIITINDSGTVQNETKRTRTNSENAAISGFFGLQDKLNKILPGKTPLSNLVGNTSDLSNDGKGTIGRSEKINLRLAGLIAQVLPNGNMVLHGRQEIRINYEVRELQLAGVIRPEDISSQNTINYDQIAEARISYGGRGQLTDIQQPRYGSQFLDVIMPF